MTHFETEQMRQESFALAKGGYQISLLKGWENWSGTSLTGSAKSHGGSYRDSRERLLSRLRGRWDAYFELVGGRKELFVREYRQHDLRVRDEATADIVRQMGLQSRHLTVVQARYVSDHSGSVILLCTVHGAGIEGHGAGVEMAEDVYVVARRDRRAEWVVRESLRKARASARAMEARVMELVAWEEEQERWAARMKHDLAVTRIREVMRDVVRHRDIREAFSTFLARCEPNSDVEDVRPAADRVHEMFLQAGRELDAAQKESLAALDYRTKPVMTERYHAAYADRRATGILEDLFRLEVELGSHDVFASVRKVLSDVEGETASDGRLTDAQEKELADAFA